MSADLAEDVRELRHQQQINREKVAEHAQRLQQIEAMLLDMRHDVKEIRGDLHTITEALGTSRVKVATLTGYLTGVGLLTGGGAAGLMKLLLG